MEGAIDSLVERHQTLFGANDSGFMSRVYNTSSTVYANRLHAIGFVKKRSVLDAGCGFGQWTLQLAELNQHVDAIDVDSGRLFLLEEVARQRGLANIDVRHSSLEALPYDDAQYEAVFCYGVIFCTRWRESLAELRRVLQPGGLLYVTGNGLGWYLHLWKQRPNAASDYDPRDTTALTFANTLRYQRFGEKPQQGQILVEQEEMAMEMRALGLEVLAAGAEGTTCISDYGGSPEPFFAGEYDGHPGCYELVARLSH